MPKIYYSYNHGRYYSELEPGEDEAELGVYTELENIRSIEMSNIDLIKVVEDMECTDMLYFEQAHCKFSVGPDWFRVEQDMCYYKATYEYPLDDPRVKFYYQMHPDPELEEVERKLRIYSIQINTDG